MAGPVLDIRGVTKSFGSREVLKGIDLAVTVPLARLLGRWDRRQAGMTV